jgi:hypothetical protein
MGFVRNRMVSAMLRASSPKLYGVESTLAKALNLAIFAQSAKFAGFDTARVTGSKERK